MTDPELVSQVAGVFDPSVRLMRGIHRSGRLLLALPEGKEAFGRALHLYQPQRPAARMMVAALETLSRCGLHATMLSRLNLQPTTHTISPPLPEISAGSCGILLGSPEHRMRRAIVSCRNGGRWEVAKVFFGMEGRQILEVEAESLEKIGACAAGVPQMLGLHRAGDATVMRMPYLTGSRIPAGESAQALRLLEEWAKPRPTMPITGFPEWEAIKAALAGSESGGRALTRLAAESLRPVIRHGDFARWNLLNQPGGDLIAIDWEWGHPAGMPGIDLVHYFLQDARLVERRKPADAIHRTIEKLGSVHCKAHLSKTGWGGDAILPVIACLAWKQGARHQENSEVLAAAVETFAF